MLTQYQAQKQQLKILPQQIQLLSLFHLNNLELEQRIQQELNENPLLEQTSEPGDELSASSEDVADFKDLDEYVYDDIPDYKLEYGNYFASETIPEKPLAQTADFREDAKAQFRLVSHNEDDTALADFIIDCLENDGLLQIDHQTLADDYSFKKGKFVNVEDITEIINRIQLLDPVGLACSNTRECLVLQLHQLNGKRPDVKAALQILQCFYKDLMNRNLDKIKQQLKLDEEELRIVLELIAGLRMRPVAENASSVLSNPSITPDFLLVIENDSIHVSLTRERSSGLYISNSWASMVEDYDKNNKSDKATAQYLRNKLNAARWFVQAIQQREATMLRIMNAIVEMQYDYFLEGDISLLKPMILKNIAEKVGVDISTVSRVTCNKYVDTPFGTLLLKDLFTEGILNAKGEVISNKVIQHAIEEVIQQEDKKKPYTDQQLVAILAERGFNIARRTIAKYRELLQIPVAQMRCFWA